MYSTSLSAKSNYNQIILLPLVLFELAISLKLVGCMMLKSELQYLTKTNIPEKFNEPDIYMADRFNEVTASKDNCTNAEDDLDRCSAELISLGNAFYPSNMWEVDARYCPRMRRAAECVKSASQCFQPFERQIINWVLTSTRRLNHKRCKRDSEKAKFLQLSHSCLSTMKDPMEVCMNDYIGNLVAIVEEGNDVDQLSEHDFQIQLSCCANMEFKKCIMDSAKDGCRRRGNSGKFRRNRHPMSSHRSSRRFVTRESDDMVLEFKKTLDDMTLTGPELICNSVSVEFCRSRFTIESSRSLISYRSIVPAMLKIYSNK